MKIRATKLYFYTELSEDDLKCQILNDIEAPVYPQVISNNECSAAINSESQQHDSPLSFLVKFKASYVSPSFILNGVSGIQLPDQGFIQKKVNDEESHFTSINENHYDLTLEKESDLNELVNEIRQINPHIQSFNLNDVKKYLLRTLDDLEWDDFYTQNAKWKKFKNKMLEENFKNKHCPITREDLTEYLKASRGGDVEDDLRFLKKHSAITDTKKIAVLAHFFPALYSV